MKKTILLAITVMSLVPEVHSISTIPAQTEPATVPELTRKVIYDYAIQDGAILVRLETDGGYAGRIPIGTKMSEYVMAKFTRYRPISPYGEYVTLYPETNPCTFTNNNIRGRTVRIADCQMKGIKFEQIDPSFAVDYVLPSEQHNIVSYAFFINASGSPVFNLGMWLLNPLGVGNAYKLASLETYSFAINQSVELDYMIGQFMLIRLRDNLSISEIRVWPVPVSSQAGLRGFEFKWDQPDW